MKTENSIPVKSVSVLVVGGGPAGLAAAVKLRKNGITDILVVEREKQLGGILRQCIHDGFGLTRFGATMSGPEYAERFMKEAEALGIPIVTNTTVTNITEDRVVTIVSPERGLEKYQAQAIILSMGCRERTRGALAIPGERPAGVFTAGVAQAYINLYDRMPAREVVILGSGDIGLIMARRLTLEGAHVRAVFELQPYPSGLPRNIEQCLRDYQIPLHLSHTVTNIHGRQRLEGVTVSQVDEKLQPIPGTEEYIPCDTLILSVGLLPENELSIDAGVTLDPRTRGASVDEFFQTTVPGIFAAGNVLHVHDLVDFVSMESEALADAVTKYLTAALPEARIALRFDHSVNHTVPQRISGAEDFVLSLRPSRPMKDVCLKVLSGTEVIAQKRFKRAIPAEMLRIPIDHKKIGNTQELEVRFE